MPAHTIHEFEIFMSQLIETNQHLHFFCDFEKVDNNVDEIRYKLCALNSILGVSDIRRAVQTIWEHDRSVFQVMNMLIAVRDTNKKYVLDSHNTPVLLDSFFRSVDGVVDFILGTGLYELFANQKITNLVDYVFGIETGLDSNARKNRSGHIMEHQVAALFAEYNIEARQEVYSNEWPSIAEVLGNDRKRFDFAVQRADKTYLFEINFYSDGGSKLNEVARSYSEIAPRINSVPGFEFVWITDGIGWRKAKSKLQEAYNVIPGIYNLTSIHDFLAGL